MTTRKDASAGAEAPRATRPRMPKGYGVPKTERGMMPWAATRKMLESARSYWLVTIDADGAPHLVGQWGAWIDDRWYFEGVEEGGRLMGTGTPEQIVATKGSTTGEFLTPLMPAPKVKRSRAKKKVAAAA